MFMCVLQVRCLQWPATAKPLRNASPILITLAPALADCARGHRRDRDHCGRRWLAARGRQSPSDPRFCPRHRTARQDRRRSLRPALSGYRRATRNRADTVARRETRLRRPKDQGIRLEHYRQLRGMVHDGRVGAGAAGIRRGNARPKCMSGAASVRRSYREHLNHECFNAVICQRDRVWPRTNRSNVAATAITQS
jgi:hypothetical protein